MPEVAEKVQDIYSYIISEEESFRTERVPLASNWRDWNMYEHIDRSFQLKNSKFYLGNQDYTRPFINIILPIANVNYRTEGFDVKDVEIYVDNAENYHKSFLARKFHDWWALENDIDTAIDETVESYFDYGLALVKNVNEARPEVVPLQQICFCDQTDIMSGPICLKHYYSIDQLLEMKGKWKANEVDKAILMARTSREIDQADDDQMKTPGKYVEVYELHGMFPESWLGAEKLGESWEDTGKYSPQIHIVTYYVDSSNGLKSGITLFKGKEPKPIFKALKRDPIHGRACGRGGIEELFHPQIWTNKAALQAEQMVEATSKVLLKASKAVAKRNNLKNVKHNQVIEVEGDERFEQMGLQPINKGVMDSLINKWEQVARTIGSASDPQLGLNPVSGTPLGTTEIVTAQGQGVHEWRRGKIAAFWAEIYREWVIPHMAKELAKGGRWLEELSLSELQEVAEKVSTKEANKRLKRMILAGKKVTPQEAEQFRAVIKETFMKMGTKRFIEILEDEFDNLPMDTKMNIAGKQENLAETVSKLNSIFRAVFTPQGVAMLQQPGVGELFNEILEKSGLSPVNFSTLTAPSPQEEQPLAPNTTPEMATA